MCGFQAHVAWLPFVQAQVLSLSVASGKFRRGAIRDHRWRWRGGDRLHRRQECDPATAVLLPAVA